MQSAPPARKLLLVPLRPGPLLLALLVALAALSSPAISHRAFAAGAYTGGAHGYDVSWPQCSAPLPAQPYDFGIAGVTGGRAFRNNICLAAEYAWASRAPGSPTLYMNLNYPAGTTGGNGMTGPAGNCSKRDKACQAYNYGYNAAKDAYLYAASQGASGAVWWLDIETGNTWSKTTDLNARVIQGAIDYLRPNATVGIYSTRYQWGQIAGGFSPGLPTWIAGASNLSGAQNLCLNQLAWFAGGSPWLTQYPVNGFTADYACG